MLRVKMCCCYRGVNVNSRGSCGFTKACGLSEKEHALQQCVGWRTGGVIQIATFTHAVTVSLVSLCTYAVMTDGLYVCCCYLMSRDSIWSCDMIRYIRWPIIIAHTEAHCSSLMPLAWCVQVTNKKNLATRINNSIVEKQYVSSPEQPDRWRPGVMWRATWGEIITYCVA